MRIITMLAALATVAAPAAACDYGAQAVQIERVVAPQYYTAPVERIVQPVRDCGAYRAEALQVQRVVAQPVVLRQVQRVQSYAYAPVQQVRVERVEVAPVVQRVRRVEKVREQVVVKQQRSKSIEKLKIK